MRKIIILLLCINPIVGFGQSDLGFQSYYAGAPGATHSKGEEIGWNFKATNSGSIRASVLDYKIFFSEDETIDPSDILLKDGKIATDWLNQIGLESGGFVDRSDFFSGRIRIPLDVELNNTYYFIFWIEQDIDNGETNFSNNVVTQSVYIGIRDKLKIRPVSFDNDSIPNMICDYTALPLGNRTPLLLIHGWQPNGTNVKGKTSIWNNFIRYFACDESLKNQFKPYFVQYYSNVVSVDDLGHELRLDLDNSFTEFHDRQISIVAHSMGGLVSRSFAKRNRTEGPFLNQKGGERVNKLITLGTPHHGSPMANGEIRKDRSSINTDIIEFLIDDDIESVLDNIDYLLYGIYNFDGSLIPPSDKFNRWDLRWDNYDSYYDYEEYPSSQNFWLNSEQMNGDSTNYFDDKIIAYAGGIFNSRPLASISNGLFSLNGTYYTVEKGLKNFGFVNDGIVPFLSATFQGHQLNNVRPFRGYYHDEIAKGRFDMLNSEGLDTYLFDFIKQDLLEEDVDAQIMVSSNQLQYPDTVVDNSSQNSITIQSVGDVQLTINSIQLLGSDNSQFTFGFPAVPFNIQPNQTETFIVDFTPTSIGEKSVTFRVNNSSENNPILDIQLSGTAVQTATTNYNTNTESLYDFGDVYIYGGSNLVTLNVSNSSSASYTVADLNITGANANLFTIVQEPVFPKLFNPGDSDIVVLIFNPDTIGEKTAVIEASFQDNTILDTANLIGNGVNTVNNPNAPKLTNYEYWYNSDYASKQNIRLTASNSNESLNFSANPLNTNNGLNVLHFRAKDTDDSWSSVSSDYVHIQNATNGASDNQIVNYEYWFDDEYANKVIGNTNASNLVTLNIDATTNLNKGLHRFNIRFKDSKQCWSSILTDFILKGNEPNLGFNTITEYRYWFNQDFTNMSSIDISPMETFVLMDNIDMSSFTTDTFNYIHFQFKDIYGNWSSVLTEEVFLCGVIAQPIISADSNLLSTETATAYQWYLDGDLIDGATNQFYEATEQGDYTVETTNSNGCKSISEVFIYSTLSLTNEELNTIKVFPNPAKNQVFVISKTTEGKLDLYNSLGQLILNYNNIPKKINVSNLESAIYFLKIQTENNKTQTFKIIKQ